MKSLQNQIIWKTLILFTIIFLISSYVITFIIEKNAEKSIGDNIKIKCCF